MAKFTILDDNQIIDNIVEADDINDIGQLPTGWTVRAFQQGDAIPQPPSFPYEITVTPASNISLPLIAGGLNTAEWTATENETIDIAGNYNDSDTLRLTIHNDATPRTISFGDNFSNVNTLVGNINKKAILEFKCIGTDYYETLRLENLT